MARVATWRGQGLTDGTVLTTAVAGAGDTPWGAVGQAPVVRIASGRDRPEVQIAATSTAHQFRWNGLALAAWSLRFYLRIDAPASALATILYLGHAGGRLLAVNLNTSGTLSLLNASGTVVSTSAALSTLNMYRVEVSGSDTGNVDVRVFECDGYGQAGTAFWTRAGQAIGTTAPLVQAIFGRQSGGAYGPGWFSEFALNDVVGLIGTADEAADESNVELWWGDGTTFRQLESWWGTGASFTRAEWHCLDGTAVSLFRRPFPGSFWYVERPPTAVYEQPQYASNGTVALNATAELMLERGPGQVNRSTFSALFVDYDPAAPVVEIRHGDTNAVLVPTSAGMRIPIGTTPPAGTDRNTAVMGPDGTGWELFKFTRVSDTVWTSTYVVSVDFRGTGLTSGITAAGISTVGGLIRKWELDAGYIGHIIAGSLHQSLLDPTPTAADGQLAYQGGIPVGVWPARQRDNQTVNAYYGDPGVPIGSVFAIPWSVDVEALPITDKSKVVARALQQYGWLVRDRSDYTTIYMEPSIPSGDEALVKPDWQTVLIPLLRRVRGITAANPAGLP